MWSSEGKRSFGIIYVRESLWSRGPATFDTKEKRSNFQEVSRFLWSLPTKTKLRYRKVFSFFLTFKNKQVFQVKTIQKLQGRTEIHFLTRSFLVEKESEEITKSLLDKRVKFCDTEWKISNATVNAIFLCVWVCVRKSKTHK